jgi:hypothetical protein
VAPPPPPVAAPAPPLPVTPPPPVVAAPPVVAPPPIVAAPPPSPPPPARPVVAAAAFIEEDFPLIPLKPLEEDEDVLEELDLLLEDDQEAEPEPEPAPPPPPSRPAELPPWARDMYPPPWTQDLDPPPRPRPAAPRAARPPAPPVAAEVPPPPLRELPTLRFAALAPEREREDVYRTPGALGTWLKRLFLAGGLAGGAVAALVTWPTWMPKLTELSVLLFSRGQERPNLAGAAGSAATSAPAPPSPQVAAALERLPHLGRRTVEAVMATSDGGLLAVPEVFRRAYQASRRGQPALSADEARELRQLESAVLAGLRQSERERVRAYGRIGPGQDLLTAEDDRVLGLFARGVHKLPVHQRERLQSLTDKAVAAALEPAAAAPAR